MHRPFGNGTFLSGAVEPIAPYVGLYQCQNRLPDIGWEIRPSFGDLHYIGRKSDSRARGRKH